MSSTLLTRTTAPKVILFFDLCFKRGVIDACEEGDDLGVKEFYEKRLADWRLGPIGSDDDYDWHMYRYWLYWIAREHRLKSLAESYLFRLNRKNYVWCLLPYCMRFYLMGISEWLKYPNPAPIEIFKGRPRVHWDPNSPNQAITRIDIMSYLHNFEYEYMKLPEEVKQVGDMPMSSFVKALFDLSRKYVTGREEEDF